MDNVQQAQQLVEMKEAIEKQTGPINLIDGKAVKMEDGKMEDGFKNLNDGVYVNPFYTKDIRIQRRKKREQKEIGLAKYLVQNQNLDFSKNSQSQTNSLLKDP
uniref:Uncharacterized protein n=1 Tax=Ditylenchus dipsaci TaxID=166011 RepID=A0A915CQ62_9BILA